MNLMVLSPNKSIDLYYCRDVVGHRHASWIKRGVGHKFYDLTNDGQSTRL